MTKQEIKEKYQTLLKSPYNKFFFDTHMKIEGMCDHAYAIDRKNDTEEERIKYLDFLINELHFNIPVTDRMIEIKLYLHPSKSRKENIDSAARQIASLTDEEFDAVCALGELNIQC